MSGLAGLAMGAAPIAGGALLAAAAGQLKGPFRTADFRELIKQDQDLLKGIPPEQNSRRAELQRTIDERIDDLIAATDRSRALRQAGQRLPGQLARRGAVCLHRVVRRHLVECVPQQDQLAADVHSVDPAGGRYRLLRCARLHREPP